MSCLRLESRLIFLRKSCDKGSHKKFVVVVVGVGNMSLRPDSSVSSSDSSYSDGEDIIFGKTQPRMNNGDSDDDEENVLIFGPTNKNNNRGNSVEQGSILRPPASARYAIDSGLLSNASTAMINNTTGNGNNSNSAPPRNNYSRVPSINRMQSFSGRQNQQRQNSFRGGSFFEEVTRGRAFISLGVLLVLSGTVGLYVNLRSGTTISSPTPSPTISPRPTPFDMDFPLQPSYPSKPIYPSPTQSIDWNPPSPPQQSFIPTQTIWAKLGPMRKEILESFRVKEFTNNAPALTADLFDDQDSPYFRALLWIANQDKAYLQNVKGGTRGNLIAHRWLVVTLYYALNGEEWKSNYQWLTNADECDWEGIVCNDVYYNGTERVVEINLPNRKLSGQVPAEISYFTFLKKIDLSNNMISGTIPPTIGRLSMLTTLQSK